MDVDLGTGEDYREVITRTIRSASVVAVIISPDWLRAAGDDGKRRLDDPNDFVRIEIAAALSASMMVVPVLVNGATMPPFESLPTDLGYRPSAGAGASGRPWKRMCTGWPKSSESGRIRPAGRNTSRRAPIGAFYFRNALRSCQVSRDRNGRSAAPRAPGGDDGSVRCDTGPAARGEP